MQTPSVPLVSVCMPMYNASRYLRECIDSILAQAFVDFELLIVDDGSEDESADIVESYADSRIRLIRNRHDYIGSLNLLLKEARGKYIARMDADDVMMPYRLKTQYDYMEAHPDVDILGGGMRYVDHSDDEVFIPITGEIWYHELLESCCLAHPTTMMRSSSLQLHDLQYRQAYIYAEDYAFWTEALSKGLKIVNISDILLKYRFTDGQVSQIKTKEQSAASQEIQKWICRLLVEATCQEVAEARPIESKAELTVVIPFYNEGEELGNTLRSIRETAGEMVDIIVVNDHSMDGYDYLTDIAAYNVHYVENKHRIGAGATKEKGVKCCTSEYFIILDAHMRFYSSEWADILLRALKAHPQSIHCCKASFLSKKDGKIVCTDNETVTTFGAYIYFGLKKNIPAPEWITNPGLNFLKSDLIPCVLGACYATSKTYWNKLGGFNGLLGYGCEEPFISLKAWLEGGCCRLIRDIRIGHLYKTGTTDFHMHAEYIYNYLIIAELLFPEPLKCRAKAVIMATSMAVYPKARKLLDAAACVIEKQKSLMSAICCWENWENILKVNNVLSPEDAVLLEHQFGFVAEILNFCEGHATRNRSLGLYNGECCLMLLYALLYKHSSENTYLEKVYAILNDLKDGIEADEVPISFENGLLGIGVALMYLKDMDVLRMQDIRGCVSMVDCAFSMLNPATIEDKDILTDMSIYCAIRLGFCKRYGIEHRLHPVAVESLVKHVPQVISRISPASADLRRLSLLLLMASCGSPSWCTTKIDIQEIIRLPIDLPQEKEYWKPGLMGCTGFAINLLVTKLKFKNV